MPTASALASPNRSDSGPVTKNWVKPETAPAIAKHQPTCFGPQPNRASPHSPNTDSMPVKAKPTRNVTSISRPITGCRETSPNAFQRLGPAGCRRRSATSGSRMKRISARRHVADSAAAISSGMRNPAGPTWVRANTPPIDGPTTSPRLAAAPIQASRRVRFSGGVTSAI